DQLASLGEDQRIDLKQAHVLGYARLVETGDQALGLLGGIAHKAERPRRLTPMMRHDAGRRIDAKGDDLLRTGPRHLLDVHPARSREYQSNTRRLPVYQCGEIELLLDRRAFLDIEAVNHFAVRTGLMGDQRRAQ